MHKRPTVLFVDDERHIRTLVRYNLDRDGYQVLLAANGKEGLRMAQKEEPSLILLDVMMPEMDGLEVLAKLKHNKKTSRIPVFMLTAKSMIGDMERAFALGADDYITKPFEPAELGETIARKLRKLAKRRKEARNG